MTLSTLLILTVCRTRDGYEIRLSLCGSVVEHLSVDSEGLRFDSSRGLLMGTPHEVSRRIWWIARFSREWRGDQLSLTEYKGGAVER